MIETLARDSSFLTADLRKNRWAIPYHYESTNSRIENIIIHNLDLIKDRTILDLGCHFGTFTYAALKHGAKHVLGVDSEQPLIDQAYGHLASHEVQRDRYDFVVANAIQFLRDDSRTFDTILCLGLFYYIQDPIEFLKLMQKKARVVILDTFTAYYSAIVSKDGIAIAANTLPQTFELPIVFHPMTQAKKKDYVLQQSFTRSNKSKALSLLSLPTLKAFEYFFELTGFTYRKLSWLMYTKNNYLWQDFIQLGVKKDSHWADLYATDIRVTFVLTGQKAKTASSH